MPEEKISAGQAAILLFLSQAFNTLNYIPAFHEVPDATAQLRGTGVALLLQLLFLIPALLLERKYEGQNVISMGYCHWRPLGVAFAILYAFAMLTQLIGSLVGFEYFLTNAVFPNASVVLIVLTMGGACFWAARHGLQSLARSAGVIFVFFVLSALFISGASIFSINRLNLRPSLSQPLRGTIQAGFSTLSKSSELYLLLLLFPKIKGRKLHTALGLTLGGFVFQFVTSFLILAVLGEFGRKQTFPYYTLASISELSIFQRLDSLHMAIWTFITFLRLTLLILLIVYCLKTVLPTKVHSAILPVLFLVTTSGAILLGHFTEILDTLTTRSGIVVPLLTAGFPLLVLLISPGNRKEGAYETGKTPVIIESDSD